MSDFLDFLRKGAVVFDAALGTSLYEEGLLYNSCLDAANLSKPAVVESVHRSHIHAGAQVIQTNTFGANRYRLQTHGLQDKVVEINRRGAEIARAAAGDDVYVVGSVGPTGKILRTMLEAEHTAIREAFTEQANALLEVGVDALILETFRQPDELELAVQGVREAVGAQVPLIASVSFDTFGTMADGTEPEVMAKTWLAWGVDAGGVNCADGPAGVYEMCVRLRDAGVPLIAQPNAGLPRRVEGRFAYLATPEYFQIFAKRLFKAGVKAVGGCCGTTPEHIAKIALAARMFGAPGKASSSAVTLRSSIIPSAPAEGVSVTPREKKSELGRKLGTKFVISVEVNPPPGLILDKALEGARLLKEGGVDVINVADGPRASARMGNLALCARVQNEVGLPAIMHVTTRDRNILGLVAHLLCAHDMGVNNLVVITGDPPKMGDFPDASAVYDTDSIGLLRIVDGLNRGYDPGGKPLGGATSFLSATGAEPAAPEYDNELQRLRQKVEAGAEFVMTQPVYDVAVLDRFIEDARPLGVPILVGLLPLASYRNAEFLHNEVPGMRVPDEIRERMRKAGSGESGRSEGVQIAREMLEAVKDRVDGAYLMPPFGRYELALRVIEGLT